MANSISPLGSLPLVPTGMAMPRPIGARPTAVPASSAAVKGSGGNPAAAAAQVNEHLQQADLKLQMDAGSGRAVYQVIQQGTGEVVLQIPSEEVLGISRRLREMEGKAQSSGALVDKEG